MIRNLGLIKNTLHHSLFHCVLHRTSHKLLHAEPLHYIFVVHFSQNKNFVAKMHRRKIIRQSHTVPKESDVKPPPRRSRSDHDIKRTSETSSPDHILDRHPPSSKYGYIFMVGPLDCGKSTTLNRIFGGREISPVERAAGTTNIMEFNSKNLRIIDTPGLGGMNSLEWDARLLATLKKFMDRDDELTRSIPHIVIIVARFDDPKIQNEDSSFVKTLKALNLLSSRLFSNNHCNLIVLLTHFMNEKKIVRENPNQKIQLVRGLVRVYLNKSCHVVFGDNEAEDWGLPALKFGHRLPTGDIYPGNLIDLIGAVMGRSRIISDVFQIRSTVAVSMKNNIPLVETSSSRYAKSLVALDWAYKPVTELPTRIQTMQTTI